MTAKRLELVLTFRTHFSPLRNDKTYFSAGSKIYILRNKQIKITQLPIFKTKYIQNAQKYDIKAKTSMPIFN